MAKATTAAEGTTPAATEQTTDGKDALKTDTPVATETPEAAPTPPKDKGPKNQYRVTARGKDVLKTDTFTDYDESGAIGQMVVKHRLNAERCNFSAARV